MIPSEGYETFFIVFLDPSSHPKNKFLRDAYDKYYNITTRRGKKVIKLHARIYGISNLFFVSRHLFENYLIRAGRKLREKRTRGVPASGGGGAAGGVPLRRWRWCRRCLAAAADDFLLCRNDRIFRLHRLNRLGDESESESPPPPPPASSADDESDDEPVWPLSLLLEPAPLMLPLLPPPPLLLLLLLDQNPVFPIAGGRG